MTPRSLVLVLLAGAAAFTTACDTHATPDDAGLTGVLSEDIKGPTNCAQPPDVDGGTVAAVVAGNSKLALQLFGQLTTANAGKNVFLSPYSVSTAFAMAYQGANGTTATQLTQTLDYPADLDNDALAAGFGALACQIEANGAAPDGGQVDVANAVFGQQGETFEAPFTTTLDNEFGAPFTPVDFATDPDGVRQDIDAWVSRQTNAMIPQLLSPGSIDASMQLVLVDALYFNEAWETTFNPATNGAFHLSAQQDVQVPLMTGTIENARYYTDSTVTLAELPFQNAHEAMDFLLPATGGSLATLEASLTAAELQGWLAGLATTSVLVTIPKFNVDWSSNLIPAFQALGLEAPFDPTQADFSGIDGAKDLSISLLQHEAVLTVQESGVTAAAATALGFAGSAAPQFNQTFSATQPFLVVLRDLPTGTILFLGQVTNPSGP